MDTSEDVTASGAARPDRNPFEGCVVVVTGAGRGLGAAIAIELAALGARPLLAGRRVDALAGTAAAIEAAGAPRPPCVALDLADPRSVGKAAEAIARLYPRIDVLVNNGAQWLESRDGDFCAEEVHEVVGAAITGTFLLTQALMPLLRTSTRPDVLTIGSISGLDLPAGAASVPFYAAKHGQRGLIEGLRQQFVGTPVRSIGIHPPEIEDVAHGSDAWRTSPERPKGSAVTNRDIVDAVVFALGRPRHVTLASIVIDADRGGLSG
jgi:NADP-dependent 3-hydroxy acid dehydrogenase YdfG